MARCTQESQLAAAYRRAAERHAPEAGVRLLCTRFAARCEAHAQALGPVAERYGDGGGPDGRPGLLERLANRARHASAEASRPMLLADLRELYLAAHECAIDWELVSQGAKAARDGELVGLAGRCHAEMVAQGRALRTQLEEAAPQVLVAG